MKNQIKKHKKIACQCLNEKIKHRYKKNWQSKYNTVFCQKFFFPVISYKDKKNFPWRKSIWKNTFFVIRFYVYKILIYLPSPPLKIIALRLDVNLDLFWYYGVILSLF